MRARFRAGPPTKPVRYSGPTKPVGRFYLNGGLSGFVPARRASYRNDDTYWDSFMFGMHKAMLAAGFPSLFSRGLVGAMDEMQNNIHDHSDRSNTGLIAYRVSADRVEGGGRGPRHRRPLPG